MRRKGSRSGGRSIWEDSMKDVLLMAAAARSEAGPGIPLCHCRSCYCERSHHNHKKPKVHNTGSFGQGRYCTDNIASEIEHYRAKLETDQAFAAFMPLGAGTARVFSTPLPLPNLIPFVLSRCFFFPSASTSALA